MDRNNLTQNRQYLDYKLTCCIKISKLEKAILNWFEIYFHRSDAKSISYHSNFLCISQSKSTMHVHYYLSIFLVYCHDNLLTDLHCLVVWRSGLPYNGTVRIFQNRQVHSNKAYRRLQTHPRECPSKNIRISNINSILTHAHYVLKIRLQNVWYTVEGKCSFIFHNGKPDLLLISKFGLPVLIESSDGIRMVVSESVRERCNNCENRPMLPVQWERGKNGEEMGRFRVEASQSLLQISNQIVCWWKYRVVETRIETIKTSCIGDL